MLCRTFHQMFYNDLDFSNKLEISARNIYNMLWPFSTYSRLTAVDGEPHIFDLIGGIDSIITLGTGESIPIQEKFRRHDKLHYQDLVLEFKNGNGTQGEYFHLYAHYLVLAYASEDERRLTHFKIYNVPMLVKIISEAGGLRHCGSPIQNAKHGKAFAFAVPWETVQDAVVWQGEPFSMSVDISGEIDDWQVL